MPPLRIVEKQNKTIPSTGCAEEPARQKQEELRLGGFGEEGLYRSQGLTVNLSA